MNISRFLFAPLLAFAGRQRPHASRAMPKHQGLWWAFPDYSEAGWALHIAHQGNTLFATWLTYDSDGTARWLVMPAAASTAARPNTFEGEFYRTRGPHFATEPYNPGHVIVTPAGTGRLDFDDRRALFTYTIDGVTQTKRLTPQLFGRTLPYCDTRIPYEFFANALDLWWGAPAEPGWGVAIAHQDSSFHDLALYAAVLTYDASGNNTWFVMPRGKEGEQDSTYSGALCQMRGPSFSATPWSPAAVTIEPVGTASFIFTDFNNAFFTFTIHNVTRTRSITRHKVSAPDTICHELFQRPAGNPR